MVLKKYIYKLQVFSSEIGKVCNKLIRNRETFDYNVTKSPIKENVLKDLNSAKSFIEIIHPYIIEKIAEDENI